ncbi:MAG: hypothetical protein JSU01_20690 [Bacteroidetes bacterium]|nr:hypothetical protein [Bacteroidota bacterium]
MKKFILFLILAHFSVKSKGQTKDTISLAIDYFDPSGNKYMFTKKFDHVPTRDDSLAFEKETSIIAHKKIDSARRQLSIELNNSKKKLKKKRPKN